MRPAAAVLGIGLALTATAAALPAVPAAAVTVNPQASKPPAKPRKPPPAKPRGPVAPGPPPVPVTAVPGPGCPPPSKQQVVSSTPWAQQALNFTAAWPLSEGRGQTVAVVDSGVDSIAQLAGRMTAVDLTGTGPRDCVGHGTEIASIIAGGDDGFFAGVAPQARIMAVKVQNSDEAAGNAGLLATGIREAAFYGATVINVSITTGPSAILHAAVEYAQAKGAVVVAAAGNDSQPPGGGSKVHGPFYPANYPGVISVGDVQQDGSLAPISDKFSKVAVTAPGTSITAIGPRGLVAGVFGTSYSTAFVSGIAALIRARFPQLTAAQVAARIAATADGGAGLGTGAGLVNPVQAVTAVQPGDAAGCPQGRCPAPLRAPARVSVPHRPSADKPVRDATIAVASGALGVAALILIAVLVTLAAAGRRGARPRRGRRRAALPPGARAAGPPGSAGQPGAGLPGPAGEPGAQGARAARVAGRSAVPGGPPGSPGSAGPADAGQGVAVPATAPRMEGGSLTGQPPRQVGPPTGPPPPPGPGATPTRSARHASPPGTPPRR